MDASGWGWSNSQALSGEAPYLVFRLELHRETEGRCTSGANPLSTSQTRCQFPSRARAGACSSLEPVRRLGEAWARTQAEASDCHARAKLMAAPILRNESLVAAGEGQKDLKELDRVSPFPPWPRVL